MITTTQALAFPIRFAQGRHWAAFGAIFVLVAAGCASGADSVNTDGAVSIKAAPIDCETVPAIPEQLCEPLAEAAESAQTAEVKEAFQTAFENCTWAFELAESACEQAGDPNDPNADPNDPNADPNDPNADPNDPNADPNDPNADPNDPNADPNVDDPSECVEILDQQVECLALLEQARDEQDEDAQEALLDAFEDCFESLAEAFEECLDAERDVEKACKKAQEVTEDSCGELLDVAKESQDSNERAFLLDQFEVCAAEIDLAVDECIAAQDCSVILDHAVACDAIANSVLEVADEDEAEDLQKAFDECTADVAKAAERCESRLR